MTAQYITRLELYTADLDRAVEYLTHLGLAPDAHSGASSIGAPLPDRETTVLSSGTATIAVSAPRGADGPVAAHIERHGDGIAEIVIACTDPEAARRSALTAGAVADADDTGRIGIRVPGMEPVRHVLVAAGGDREHPEVGPIRPSLFDHLALCVRTGTVGQVADFYQRGLGLDPYFSEFTEVGDQAMNSEVVQSATGGVTFVIVESAEGHEPGNLDTFLAANDGPGVHHIALLVEDLVDYVARAGEDGIDFLDAPDAYYDLVDERDPDVAADLSAVRGTGILVDTDEWGELLQVFTRSPYPRSTLFYEMIERRQARTFGTRNIRALYEAIEQSRNTVG